MTHNRRYMLLSAISPTTSLSLIYIKNQYYILFVIALNTFVLIMFVSMMWSIYFDPTKPPKLRFGLRTIMVAIALIALQMAALMKWQERFSRDSYSATASYHKSMAQLSRDHSLSLASSEYLVDDPSDTAPQRESRKYARALAKAASEEAAYHDSLRQKYEQAARFPLHPVEPDPPPPKSPKPRPSLKKTEPDRPIE